MSPKKLSSDPRHALNAICPYFTMFPLEYPLRILSNKGGARRVLDPFCGRGTTLYAARVKGIESWGIDTSPVAVAIAQAKQAQATSREAISLARRILESEPEQTVPRGSFWRLAYHREVLQDLCRLRSALMRKRSDVAVLLRALALGCLHGPLTKRPDNPSYFSNQMPRTFAPKPDYSVRYWDANGLKPSKLSVLRVLEKKAARISIEELPRTQRIGSVIGGNAELPSTFSRLPRRFDTVITSPPYFGMVNYVQDQWLRNWFLGGPDSIDYARTEQLSHKDPEAFATSLARVWDNVGSLKSKRLDLFIRFGAIPSYDIGTLDVLKQSLSLSLHAWKVVSVRGAKTAESGKRQATHMNIESCSVGEYDVHVALS